MAELRPVSAEEIEALEAEILADAGEPAAAVAQAERALAIADQSDGVYARGIAYRALATAFAAVAPPDWSRVNDAFGRSVDTLAGGDARLQQARTYTRWVDTLRRAGRVEDASHVQGRMDAWNRKTT